MHGPIYGDGLLGVTETRNATLARAEAASSLTAADWQDPVQAGMRVTTIQSAIFSQVCYFGLGDEEKNGVSAFGLASPNKKIRGVTAT